MGNRVSSQASLSGPGCGTEASVPSDGLLYDGVAGLSLLYEPELRRQADVRAPHIDRLRTILGSALQDARDGQPYAADTCRHAARQAAAMARQLKKIADNIEGARAIGNPLADGSER